MRCTGGRSHHGSDHSANMGIRIAQNTKIAREHVLKNRLKSLHFKTSSTGATHPANAIKPR